MDDKIDIYALRDLAMKVVESMRILGWRSATHESLAPILEMLNGTSFAPPEDGSVRDVIESIAREVSDMEFRISLMQALECSGSISLEHWQDVPKLAELLGLSHDRAQELKQGLVSRFTSDELSDIYSRA